MKKVIITGATGFFGKALTKKLLETGVFVYAIARNAEKLSVFKEYKNCEIIEIDLKDLSKLPDLINDGEIDVFYHFAWDGGFTKEITNYSLQLLNARYCGDAIMAAIAIGAKKFVYANTYNQFEIINFLSSEVFEPRKTCIYATGKTAGSLICRTLAFNNGIEYNAGLVAMPYGENNYSKQLVNVVLHSLIQGVPPKLVEGNNLYDIVYIDDIVDAFIAIGNYGKNMKEYYIGHRNLKPFKEWMIEIRDIIAPDVELRFGEYKDNQQIKYDEIDLDSLYRDTGFECSRNLSDYIAKTAEWVEKNIKW